VRAIGAATFLESYGRLNTKKNMKGYLASAFSRERIKTELKNKKSSFYLLKQGEDILGYIKINFPGAGAVCRDKNYLELERMYLLKKYQRKGLGKLLLKKVNKIAATNKMDGVWLGVWSKNPLAINFYKKNGFAKCGKQIFILGKDRQVDYVMKKIIA
jgi:ribosomal protein S18 acetylase RimI-like enzyme